MSTGELLSIEPLELKFPCKPFVLDLFRLRLRCIHICQSIFFYFCLFSILISAWKVELKKQISCSLQLLNKTENHVAFKVILFDIVKRFIFGI